MRLLCLLALAAIAHLADGGSPCAAQAVAAVAGTVSEPTGGTLPGASVRLDSVDRERSFDTSTDADGSYRLEVPAGRYDALFSATGFAEVRRTAIDVQPARTTVVDAVLQLSLSAHVTVVADTAVRHAASEGVVTAQRLEMRPMMRAGEIVEAVPGLVVSQHSGDGKANQFYLRGFNLDHGTDFAATVAGVPVNMPTHAHGQGYADLNFVITELVSGVRFKKGPYYAEEGDFSTAGAVHIDFTNMLEAPIVDVSAGGDGWRRVLAAASPTIASGRLLAAVEFSHSDGPWQRGDDYRKRNGLLRYTQGDHRSAWSLTGSTYAAEWNSTDQIPERAVAQATIGRFGAVDLSNGGRTYRHSLAIDVQRFGSGTTTQASAYALAYGVNLFSNFTYFLDDPVNGDQFEQVDRRLVGGFAASHARRTRWRDRAVEHRAGVQLRHDGIGAVGLYATRGRGRIGAVREDEVRQTAAAAWADSSIRWNTWFRTTAGLRVDGYRFLVTASRPENGGRESAALASPKLAVVLGPWRRTEWFVNVGAGFHSNDARGTTITVDPHSGEPIARVTPLVRSRGAEVGVRTGLGSNVQASAALWGLMLDSERLFVGDAGTTTAGRPSARRGIELSAEAAITRWLAVDADLAWSAARFTDEDPAGREIAGAVPRIASIGISTNRHRAVFGTLRLRHVGPRPLVEDGSARSRATTLVNAAAGLRLSAGTALVIDGFNLFDERASEVEYFYTSRLPGEPADGVADVHFHPAVPRTVRVAFRFSY